MELDIGHKEMRYGVLEDGKEIFLQLFLELTIAEKWEENLDMHYDFGVNTHTNFWHYNWDC